ncbi:PAS domain S-box-containing protein [Sphingomonas sp. BE138]|uniref:PAS domain S-box protein n=1 Tax=Sphingomonas sp. BE138 TaxID=2817845 RepID=UPI002867A744|nr:PAS domain S-box protein [Sphingomonas sp. BE138]MDR6789158.1 PAS domain S-box-containing protein [Sphingomonas sp. BE138]
MPISEAARIAALHAAGILDTPREAAFDEIAQLAAATLHTPIAVVNFVAENRQWFKAEVGIGADELPLDVSICRHAILEKEMLVVPDLIDDARFEGNPLVHVENGLRFYAGALVRDAEGMALGTVCVLDRAPRPAGLTESEKLTLRVLARQVTTQIELRRKAGEQRNAAREVADARSAETAARVALAASEAQLQAVLAAAPVGIVAAEAPSGRLLSSNQRTDEIFRHPVYAADDVSAYRVFISRHADGRLVQPDEYPMARVMAGEERPELEVLYQRGDDTHAWVRLIGAPIRDPEGAVTGGVVTVLDIDREKRAEERLKALNETLAETVDARTVERDRLWTTTTDLMGTAGLDGFMKTVNPAWTALLGWSEAEVLARPFAAIINPEDHAATVDIVRRLAAGETVHDFVDRVLAKDGSERVIQWTAVPDVGTDLFHIVGRDLTEQRAAEDALRQSQKMEAVGQLTGGLAHDFNNMLAGISGSLELIGVRLEQGRLTDVERYLVAAQGAARRAAALTHRLLAFSRRQTLEPKPTDVNRLVAGMEDLVRRTVGPSVEVEVVRAGGLWPTLVDQGQLENALLNLCINARDAMPDGGRIVVETGNRWLDERGARERDLNPGQYVSLCVSDNGTGMPADVIAKAFDPFFTTKPIGQGTGLGLSMIYGFVRQSAGQVRIYSEKGEGTMVCLYLPRADRAADEDAPGADAVPDGAEQGETVLVVDDEATIRMLVTEVLQDLGYATLEAADGAAAQRILQSDARVDLLVTDVGLPGGMNGRQLADAARARRPDLATLFITGYAENAALSHGHLGSGQHVLTKPFAMDALATRVRELLSGRDGNASAQQ